MSGTTMRTAAVIANPRTAAQLGHLGEWLDSRGITVTRLTRDDVLAPAAADAADLLIVLGSAWTVAEGHRSAAHAAAVDAELALVRRWVDSDRPMLGICFGGQVLSAALGGTVTRMPQTMLGWLTPASDHEVLRHPWALWHEDRFSVPSGAEVLAVAPHAPMAFRYRRAWGVQFHPEFTAPIMREIAHDLGTPPQRAEPLIALAEQRAPEQRRESLALFDAFYDDVTADRG